MHVMFSYHILILLHISSNFIVKFILVIWCAKETTWFVFDTGSGYFKQNLGDSCSQNVFFLTELSVWGLMGYSIFYQYLQGHGCKNPGNPMIMIFSRGFYLKLYFSRATVTVQISFRVGGWKNFSGVIFFQEIELFKI